LLGVFDFLLLIAYVILYVLFISLIHRNDETFGFMKFQVHSFFIFMILIQLGRLIVGLIFKHEKTDYGTRSLNIEFFNVSTEALFNLAILYYFIQN
jgi:hypothetical protein